MHTLEKLIEIRECQAERKTHGLRDEVVARFLEIDPKLGQAIDAAYEAHREFRSRYPELAGLSEVDLTARVQKGIVNFYPEDQQNPYVAIAAKGPWVVTAHGAILHDSGGYGMLGLGHDPSEVHAALAKPSVIANVMTPSLTHHSFQEVLGREIGRRRKEGNPYGHYICMNSGSESVTVALRISDINAKHLTDSDGRHAGKQVKFLTLAGGFHGRTDRPARASASTAKAYQHLASFRDETFHWTVEPNNCEHLREVFTRAHEEGVFFEAFLMEPVMGEGNPGVPVTREFYDLARQLTSESGTMLIMDSVQAGLRATGQLSLCDYPGFEDAQAPDMETFSKAINGGQYPLSVVALRAPIAQMYVKGVYGNTMTTNPKALEVGMAVLESMTPGLRQNIVDRGVEFVEKLKGLQAEFPNIITKVQGTGLLVAASINPEVFHVVGFGKLEEYLRTQGIGVIHGGKNALRFTPHFRIRSVEIDMIIAELKRAFENAPRENS